MDGRSATKGGLDLDGPTGEALYIRAFELHLLELFGQGLLAGTVHTCVGQEWCAAALHQHLEPGLDAFFGTHRGHGHYLAHGGPPDEFLAELMGRQGALCAGRGGSQNLAFQRFFSAGIQGSSAPIAVGFAWAMRHRAEPGIAVVQLGDGTLGEGAVYEALNWAAWLSTPVLFLVEHNGWAQSTDTSRTTTGDVLQRAQGFGVTASRVSDTDPEALSRHLCQVVAKVRTGQPHLVVVDTRRLMAHSKGDDDRPKELVERLWREDPIARLLDESAVARQRARGLESDVRVLATSVAQRPYLADLDRDPLPPNRKTSVSTTLHAELLGGAGSGRIAEELNTALHTMMAGSAEVVVVGEDLLDPYGGAFKITRGLSTVFPDRVLSTPISEAAIVGAANGMALAGMRPVVEIMFADFVTLAADQLINFAAKFHAMYAGRVRCPLTVRLVSGGGRGYGPTHSQSLETLLCGVPGLRVVALSQRHRPQALLTEVVLDDDGPVVFVEGKSLYPLRPHAKPPLDLRVVPATGSGGNLAPLRYAPAGNRRPEVTVVTYGASTAIAEAAMRGLIVSEETIFEYFVLTQLWPLDVGTIVESVSRTGRLVVVEENAAAFGVAAAVIAEVAQRHSGPLACRAIGAEPVPIPSARHLEDLVLPSPAAVGAAIKEIL